MKMPLMLMAFAGLMVACGGVVQQEAAPASVEETLLIDGTQCGANVCGTGAYCCNASCGICAPKGAVCPDVVCEVDTGAGVKTQAKAEPSVDTSIAIGGGACGTNYCGKGYFCCNPGCGVCAPVGGGCPDVMCD
jgi:hypothetical protein